VHYLLLYTAGPEYLARRADYREEHLRLAWAAQARGELVLAGAIGDPLEGAALLFRGDSTEVAAQFAAADPYVQHGLVRDWRVMPWHTVVGDDAATPVRPVSK
jgi:uncharacterized protein YciI